MLKVQTTIQSLNAQIEALDKALALTTEPPRPPAAACPPRLPSLRSRRPQPAATGWKSCSVRWPVV